MTALTLLAAFAVMAQRPSAAPVREAAAPTRAGVAAQDDATSTTQSGANKSMTTQLATFGAGCFWGVESVFMQQNGVLKTSVGYAGGKTERPTYKEVCSDRTGHAEVVQVEFDPSKISYDTLLEIFFAIHDPTTLNRQGPDVGSQYRSVVFYHSPEQQKAAEAAKDAAQASGKWGKRPIVTQIEPAPPYWPAEDYHQQYYDKRGIKASCHVY